MDQLKLSSKSFNCFKHPSKNAEFLSLDTEGKNYQLQCPSCSVASQFSSWIKLPISDILDESQLLPLHQWPPLKNKKVLQDYSSKIEEFNLKKEDSPSQIKIIQDFFQKAQDAIVNKIKGIEKLYLSQFEIDLSSSMVEFYYNISHMKRLRQCLSNESTLKKDFINLYQELLENQDEIQCLIEDQLEIMEKTCVQFDKLSLEQQFHQISSKFDEILEQICQKYPHSDYSQSFKKPQFNLNLNENNQVINRVQPAFQQNVQLNQGLMDQESEMNESEITIKVYEPPFSLNTQPLFGGTFNQFGQFNQQQGNQQINQQNNSFNQINEQFNQVNQRFHNINEQFRQNLDEPNSQPIPSYNFQRDTYQQQVEQGINDQQIIYPAFNRQSLQNNNPNNHFPALNNQQNQPPNLEQGYQQRYNQGFPQRFSQPSFFEERRPSKNFIQQEPLLLNQFIMQDQMQNDQFNMNQRPVFSPPPQFIGNQDIILRNQPRNQDRLRSISPNSQNNDLRTKIIQSFGKSLQLLKNRFKLEKNTIKSQFDEQEIGIIDFNFTENYLNSSFQVKLTFEPKSFQAVGLIEKSLILSRKENISMLMYSNQLNLIANNGLCSKEGNIVNFKFSSNDIIEIQVRSTEIVFKNLNNGMQYSQTFKFNSRIPYCPGFFLNNKAQLEIV